MRWLLVLALTGCTAAPVPPAPTLTPAPPPPTTPPLRATIATQAPPNPTLMVPLKMFRAEIAFDTYEAEENLQYELARLPGVASIVVTQLDVTLHYDPTRLTEDDILRTMRMNTEVRIKGEAHGGR